MAANIFSLMGSIFVDNTEANKSIAKTSEEGEKSGNVLAKLGGIAEAAAKTVAAVGAAALGAASALGGIAMKSAEAGDRVDKSSQKLGLTRQGYQEWDYILAQNGASIDSLGAGMKTLETAMDKGRTALDDFTSANDLLEEQLASGAISQDEYNAQYDKLIEKAYGAVPALDKLGFSLNEITEMSPEEMFDATVKKLQEMPEGAEKTRLALDLFGKQGMELLPMLNQTAEGTEELRQRAHELGIVMEDEAVDAGVKFGDTLDDAKKMVTGFGNTIGATLLPSMTAGIEAFIGFATGADEGGEKLTEAIDGIVYAITEQLPAFLEKGSQIVIKLVEGVTTAIPKLVESIMPVITDIVELIVNLLPLLIQAGMDILISIINGISQALPDLIPVVIEIIMTIVTSIIDNLPKLLDAALNIIVALTEGILKAIPVLIQKLPELITSIINFILGAIPQLIDAGIKLFIALVEALPEIIVAIVQAIPKIITGIINALINNIDKIIDAGIQLFIALVTNLPAIIVEIVKAIPQIISAVVNGFIESVPKMAETGLNLIKGLWQGINDAADWLKDKISGFFGGVVDNIKNFFGIKSPSTLFRDEIGKNIALGLSEGIDDNADKAEQSAMDMTEGTLIGAIAGADIQAFADLGSNVVGEFTEGFASGLDTMGGKLENVINTTFVDNMDKASESIINTFKKSIPNMVMAGYELFTSLIEKLPEIIEKITSAIPEIVENIENKFKEYYEEFKEMGLGIGEQIADGIKEAIAALELNQTSDLESEAAINDPWANYRTMSAQERMALADQRIGRKEGDSIVVNVQSVALSESEYQDATAAALITAKFTT